MSVKTYETLDLVLFGGIAILLEVVNFYAFTQFTGAYYLSFSLVLGLIAIFRWNAWGLLIAPLSGLGVLLLRMGLGGVVTPTLWLTYTLSYLGLAVGLLFFLKGNKKALSQSKGKMFLYFLSGCVAVEILKALFQLTTADFLSAIKSYLLLDSLNLVANALVFLVALYQKGLVTDMKSYLVETHTQKVNVNGMSRAQASEVSLEEMSESQDVTDASLLDGGTLTTDDLQALEKDRRKLEGKASRFDKENDALKDYQDKKDRRKTS